MAELSVGVSLVDAQHHGLVEGLGALVSALERSAGRAELSAALEQLQADVLAHFKTEEDYMAQTRFAGLEGHKARHETFVKTFLGLKQGLLESADAKGSVSKVQKQIGEWLVGHIATYDLEMGRFLNSAGIR